MGGRAMREWQGLWGLSLVTADTSLISLAAWEKVAEGQNFLRQQRTAGFSEDRGPGAQPEEQGGSPQGTEDRGAKAARGAIWLS